MSKIDYVIREDGISCCFSAESESELIETEFYIYDYYPYISASMEKENYRLKNQACHIFHEIVYENKVVGFAAYQVRNNLELILNECYILPEFRGKRLFFDEICKMHYSSPRFGILQPTHNVIELLLKYAFAKNVTDDIVVSAIDLYLDPFDVMSNKKDDIILILPPSNFYDSNICSTIFVYDDEIFYHGLLENDCLRGHKRRKLDKGYFAGIQKLFLQNHEKFKNAITLVKNELPDNRLGYDVLIGHGEGLSEYMQGMVEKDIISYEQAMFIRQQLIQEYESGAIDDSNIDDRFNILCAGQFQIVRDFKEFKELVNSGEIEDYGQIGFFKHLIEIIGDNDELGNELLDALARGDGDKVHSIVMNQIENDAEFFTDFIDSDDDSSPEEYYQFQKETTKEYLEKKHRFEDVSSHKDDSPSYELESYVLLDSLNNGDNYYDALEFVEMDFLAPSELLTGLLVESKFIRKEGTIEIDWTGGEVSDFPDGYLRNVLYRRNLDYEGTRDDLLKRLADNNVTLGDDYRITPEGKNFLKEHYWIGVYWEFLEDFDFTDFYRYLNGHEGELKDILLGYLDEHLKIAQKAGDENYVFDCRYAKDAIDEEFDDFIDGLNNPE